MNLDDLKREFIQYMEKAHSEDAYPRNYFGCLLTLVIEDRPTTQQRIMELTGYSQAAISQALQKIQLTMPVRRIKVPHDRKHYYEYDSSAGGFLASLMHKRGDMPDINPEIITKTLESARKRANEHQSYQRFSDYLAGLLSIINLLHSTRQESIRILEQQLFSDKTDVDGFPSIKSQELKRVLKTIKRLDIDSPMDLEMEKHEPPDYLELKREFYRAVRSGFNPIYTQEAAINMVLIHDIIIEKLRTQEQLQEVTSLPRSTISERLSQIVKSGLVGVTRTSGSLVKLYFPKVSLSDILLGYYKRASLYAITIRKKITDTISKCEMNLTLDEDAKRFISKLEELKSVYEVAEHLALKIQDYVRGTMQQVSS